MWRYLCGWHAECRPTLSHDPVQPKAAFARVRRNVKERYAVVGVMEAMGMTLESLERSIPEVFRGAGELYKIIGGSFNTRWHASFYVQATSSTLAWIEAQLNVTSNLYKWLKRRFYVQHARLTA